MSETLSEKPEEIRAQVARARRARTWRRLGTLLMVGIVMGALAGLYGPRMATASTESSWGRLEVSHPRVVRAGVDLSVSITPEPSQTGSGYTVVLDLKWVEDLGIETVTPLPSSESTTSEAWLLTYDEDPGGTVMLSGRVPTHPRVGPIDTSVGTAPAGDRVAAAALDLTTWVLP